MLTELLFGLIFAAGVPLSVYGARAEWRIPLTEPPGDTPADWPFGRPSWLVMRRSFALYIPTSVCFSAVLLLEAFDLLHGPVAELLRVLTFVTVALFVSVALLNRPSVLVPPALRKEPGFIVEVIRSWRG